MAATTPFIWSGNRAISATEAERNRKTAEALSNRYPKPQNMWEGLASLTGDVGGALLNWQSDQAEEAGRSEVAKALEAAQNGGNPNDFISVLGNEWASPSQSAVASALLNRGFAAEDRQAQWAREDSLRADDRAYEAPVRDLQLESGQFTLDQAREGFTSLVTPEERAAEGIDPQDTRPWQKGADGKLYDFGSGSGQTINVTTGGGTDDFYKKLDTDAGAQQATLLDAGRNAVSNNMRLGQLDALLADAPQGASGAFTQFAGSVGIPMQGLDEIQAAQALINQMVPGQRPPGSGTMSDADLALFKQSLPAIINQPGGNQKIIATARAINEYTIQQAAIAEKVASREITPAEGRALQASIPNPLASFGTAADKPSGAPMAISSDAEYDALPSGAEFIDPEGNRRRKP
jgi:hypothetical protein